MQYILLLNIFLLIPSAFAGNFCFDVFSEGFKAKETTSLFSEEDARLFSENLNLEQKSIWLSYLRNPNSLEVVNEYLRDISPLQKRMTVLKSDATVTGATLVRVAQWRDLFQSALLLPAGTELYYQKQISEERARRLERVIVLLEGEHIAASTKEVLSAAISKEDGSDWRVIYRMTLADPIKALPGRSELQEYILERAIQLRINHAEIKEQQKTVELEIQVEKSNDDF
jgi:hypothetical protein